MLGIEVLVFRCFVAKVLNFLAAGSHFLYGILISFSMSMTKFWNHLVSFQLNDYNCCEIFAFKIKFKISLLTIYYNKF